MKHIAPEDVLIAWVRSGPETASSEFVDRTLAPIPHMRQRGRWRIRIERGSWAAPSLGGYLAAAAAIVIAAIAIVGSIPGFGGPGATPSSSPIAEPQFELVVSGGPGPGTYRSEPSALTRVCVKDADGAWRFIYGHEGLTVDLIVGAGAGQPGGASLVAAEIEAGGGYVRFDPTQIRGGDPPGRSTASVVVDDLGGATRFAVVATTPDRTTGSDLGPVEIELTVVCPG
jgi:hypothetical protein